METASSLDLLADWDDVFDVPEKRLLKALV